MSFKEGDYICTDISIQESKYYIIRKDKTFEYILERWDGTPLALPWFIVNRWYRKLTRDEKIMVQL